MSSSEEIAALRAELRAEFDRKLNALFVWTQTANTTSLGAHDHVESADDSADPSTHQKRQRPVARVEEWGSRGVPPGGLRGLSLFLGSSNGWHLGIGPTEKYGPTGLQPGDKCLYNSVSGVQVLLKASDGSVTITDGAGNSLVVDGTSSIIANAAYFSLRRLISVKAPGQAAPSSSDATHLAIDASSDDHSGLFTLQNGSAGGSVSIDVTYAVPYPSGSRVRIQPCDSAAATTMTPPTASATPGLMMVYVDAANTNASKFRVVNSIGAGSQQTPAGKFYYFVDGY